MAPLPPAVSGTPSVVPKTKYYAVVGAMAGVSVIAILSMVAVILMCSSRWKTRRKRGKRGRTTMSYQSSSGASLLPIQKESRQKWLMFDGTEGNDGPSDEHSEDFRYEQSNQRIPTIIQHPDFRNAHPHNPRLKPRSLLKSISILSPLPLFLQNPSKSAGVESSTISAAIKNSPETIPSASSGNTSLETEESKHSKESTLSPTVFAHRDYRVIPADSELNPSPFLHPLPLPSASSLAPSSDQLDLTVENFPTPSSSTVVPNTFLPVESAQPFETDEDLAQQQREYTRSANVTYNRNYKSASSLNIKRKITQSVQPLTIPSSRPYSSVTNYSPALPSSIINTPHPDLAFFPMPPLNNISTVSASAGKQARSGYVVAAPPKTPLPPVPTIPARFQKARSSRPPAGPRPPSALSPKASRTTKENRRARASLESVR